MKYLLPLMLLGTLAGCAQTPKNQTTYQKPNYETYIAQGESFPISQFNDMKGETVELAEDKRKLVLLFATWCSDSQRFVKQLMASPLIADPDLQIIAIGREEDVQSLVNFSEKFATNFTMVADPERKIYSQFANAGVPRIILLDKQNRVVSTLIGEAPNTIEKVLW